VCVCVCVCVYENQTTKRNNCLVDSEHPSMRVSDAAKQLSTPKRNSLSIRIKKKGNRDRL